MLASNGRGKLNGIATAKGGEAVDVQTMEI